MTRLGEPRIAGPSSRTCDRPAADPLRARHHRLTQSSELAPHDARALCRSPIPYWASPRAPNANLLFGSEVMSSPSRKPAALPQYLRVSRRERHSLFVRLARLRKVERSRLQKSCQRQVAFGKRRGERQRLLCTRLRLVKTLANLLFPQRRYRG